jgi:hypothetical protein
MAMEELTRHPDRIATCDCHECALHERNRLRALARDAYAAWNADRDMRTGKLLGAMVNPEFSKHYRPDLEAKKG